MFSGKKLGVANRQSLLMLALGLYLTTIIASPASGDVLYSIDVDNDRLVTIDTSTGIVHVCGDLAFDPGMVDVDLALADGILYALASAYPTHVDILAINPIDAVVISSSPVTYNGSAVTHAEGLAMSSGHLVAGVRTGENSSLSNALGELSRDLPLDGVLTEVFDYSVFDPIADCDGMTGLPDGRLLWWNTEPGPSYYRLVAVDTPPDASYSIMGEHEPHNGVNDIVLAGENLWGIDRPTSALVRIDPDDGHILESRPYDYSHELRGLALAEISCPVDRVTVLADRLDQNHPNPFNPVTCINFNLPRYTVVDLTVFTLSGMRVETLIKSGLPAGDHSATWTGQDSQGRAMPSGTYIYRMRTEDRTETRSMTLLR